MLRRVTAAFTLFLGVGLLSLLALAQIPQKQNATTPPASQKQIDELKAEIASLRSQLQKSEGEVIGLQLRVSTLESAHQSVVLDLASRNYQRLDTDTGMFLISVTNVASYLDGYKISLKIGNPSSAQYNGFKLKAKWNHTYNWDKYTAESYSKWDKATREKETSFIDSLNAGTWNKVDLILPATAADELGYFIVSMETDTIVLYRVN